MVYLISLALYTGIIPGNRRSLFGPCRVMLPTYHALAEVTGSLEVIRIFGDAGGYRLEQTAPKLCFSSILLFLFIHSGSFCCPSH
jgi:hypothetical protein